jgi:hypothetical protein
MGAPTDTGRGPVVSTSNAGDRKIGNIGPNSTTHVECSGRIGGSALESRTDHWNVEAAKEPDRRCLEPALRRQGAHQGSLDTAPVN